MMSPVLWLVASMILAGLIGGIVNLALEGRAKEDWFTWSAYRRELAISLASALLTPLFLSMTSSQLVNDFIGCPVQSVVQQSEKSEVAIQEVGSEKHRPSDPTAGFLFFGFCLVAAISSKRFIQTISDKVLQRVEEVAEDAKEAKREVTSIKNDVEDIVEKRTEQDSDAIGTNAFGESSQLALTDLNDHQKMILKAFYDKRTEYDCRSVRGIAKDSKVPESNVPKELDALAVYGLAVQRKSRGPTSWSLTPTGLNVAKPKDGQD